MRTLPRLALLVQLACLSVAASAEGTPPPVAAAMQAVGKARKVMMNDPAAALAIGIDLERRGANVVDARQRRVVLARAKWIAGEASLRLNRIHDATRMIDASYQLAVASGDPQAQGDALLSRGSVKSQSDPAGALQDYLKAFRWFQQTADARSQSITLQHLANLYGDAQDFRRAESYLRQAGEIYHGEPLTQLALANNTANLLTRLGEFAKAEREFTRGLAIARDLGLYALELRLLSNVGLALIRQGRLTEASRTMSEMARLSRRTGVTIDGYHIPMARLAFAQGKFALARRLIALDVAPSGRAPPAFDEEVQQFAYEIYKAAGDTRLALQHLEIAMRMRNDTVTLGISNKAALMAARFDFGMQDLRIARLRARTLQQDVAAQREAAARVRRISVALVGLVVMLSIWLTAVRRSRNRFRTVNGKLELANTALEAAVREVEERSLAEYRATELARHDPLTGLPNRRQLNEVFAAGLQADPDDGGNKFLLLLDLDRFKPINDLHGHAIGDLVLVATAERLKAMCSRDHVSAVRLGGDEFVVVMSGFHDDDDVQLLARDIIQELGRPISVERLRLRVGVSIGIARAPQDGTTIGDLLRAADLAMYEAKRSGRDAYRFFDAAMKSRDRLRVA